MPAPRHPNHAAERAASLIGDAFVRWTGDFRLITLQARDRFEHRDWLGVQHDSSQRLALYGRHVHACVEAVQALLGAGARDRGLWCDIKDAFRRALAPRADGELGETFFSSVSRRIFVTVGVDPEIEFIDPHAPIGTVPTTHVTHTFPMNGSLPFLVRDVLEAYRFSIPYDDAERDAALVAAEIAAEIPASEVEAIELARPVFFRNKGAYLVGHVRTARGHLPLVLALLNDDDAAGVRVDAALTTEDDVSIVFSFTRSYFLVETDRPRELVAFLRTIMPRKPIAELYTAIGHHKRAKTELYHDLLRHLGASKDRFEIARGARGMVMIAFTMPSYDVIFKVVRDRFDYPKTATRRQVMDKYELVFEHDRAGRLIDAQEFEHLRFARARFSDALLEELTTAASDTVAVQGDDVIIRHVYTERRVTPLDLYLQGADGQAARKAVLDYGMAVRDLAATNIFPGDLLLKNFGVTRHGRVVFYDYDELRLLSDCRFRRLPPPRDPADELYGEAWFYVDDRDVFPEEFISFLELRGPLRDVFLSHHGCLFHADFWTDVQQQLLAGRVIDLFPYPASKRLPADRGQAVSAASNPVQLTQTNPHA